MATEEVNKPPSLPPYPEMITKAIEALNGENGSNKSGISKYIESTYGNLPAGHSSLLTHHLNMMKASGELIFWKNNYMKRDPSTPARRGRGRPPKQKTTPVPSAPILSPAKPRGRPPKDPNAPPKPPKPVKMKVSGTGKPRGRPRKFPQPVSTEVSTPATATVRTGRPRGRPPKVKTPLTEVSVQQ